MDSQRLWIKQDSYLQVFVLIEVKYLSVYTNISWNLMGMNFKF